MGNKQSQEYDEASDSESEYSNVHNLTLQDSSIMSKKSSFKSSIIKQRTLN